MTFAKKVTTESGIEIKVEGNFSDGAAEIILRSEGHRNCTLHWGVRRSPYSPWQVPPRRIWPEGSKEFEHGAVQTRFTGRNGYDEIIIRLDLSTGFRLIDFVLFFPGEGRWDNNRGRNYRIEIPWSMGQESYDTSLGDPELDRLAGSIIEKEMGRNSWTLMHRFDLCYDLLDRVKGNDLNGMALIFVWLRFSFIRQLDWQRNYNTKPRELGHAMDRLSLKLAGRYGKEKNEREIIRLIMTTLGRGSNAQRVRDEVLNIMHRHNIKEISGHFMEEWHQKLHNNTTPDDVIICEAYLEFLRNDGNLRLFYRKLEDGGVTKRRLESYERPIRSAPDFIPHLKDALIRDFEHFLGILKEVHTGTDLGIAIQNARYLFDAEMNGLMDFIWARRDDPDMNLLIKKITESRKRLAVVFEGPPHQMRDFLFLDIALEDFLRVVVERNIGVHLKGEQLADLITMVLDNICLSVKDVEFQLCLNHWRRLGQLSLFGKEWSLHAIAALDRIRRAIGSFVDFYKNLIQRKAGFLGNAFHAESWAVSLFSEEVLRGRPAFVLSMILHYLDPILRKNADLGNWQVISRGTGAGEVKIVETLVSVQGSKFAQPVILIVGEITGNEEIPQGVAAIVTPSVIDGLSHLAIRARNDGVLFAICYDPETIDQLKFFKGRKLRLSLRNANDLNFEESSEEIGGSVPRTPRISGVPSAAAFTAYAVAMNDFSEHNVGYKSNKLGNIRGKLPDWINLPPSAALPFGVFEKVMAESANKEILLQYEELTARLETMKEEERRELLAELRDTILSLNAHNDLVASLKKVMEETGLAWPSDWNEAWTCIKRVWGSKWNERAYLSRDANGIPHDALQMSVLVQSVVESDYSFVIHTINPFTGVKDEVYAEVVPGLGETLAANYPGRALSFTCRKGDREPHLLSMPSKSIGLYGKGLIFRSDSNGEDLAGYAGAGLYDSFVLPSPRRVSLDYTADKLIWDEGFRKDLLPAIAEIGRIVEEVARFPQDIEGAYSKGKYFVVQTRPQVGIV